eukprot:1250184-Alexandrium_andersonii.AAC.1
MVLSTAWSRRQSVTSGLHCRVSEAPRFARRLLRPGLHEGDGVSEFAGSLRRTGPFAPFGSWDR